MDDFLQAELDSFEEGMEERAVDELRSFIRHEWNTGDLLSLDYDIATILVHDYQRQQVGGIPLGCFLLATRLSPENVEEGDEGIGVDDEDASLILLRVTGKASLPNEVEAAYSRFQAGQRALDSEETWDSVGKTDQFTLNQLRISGIECRVIGTFRQIWIEENYHIRFSADISNFYAGQGMKVYKPQGSALTKIVNYQRQATDDSHPLQGQRVTIGRVRYAASEPGYDEATDRVPVELDPTDLIARRTALFGMSRTGKSNTTKMIASAVFHLRSQDPENGRIGQLIFDVNGEYANDNPQDSGCLRNLNYDYSEGDVVTYGLRRHPHDPERRIMKINFFGSEPQSWNDRDEVENALEPLLVGKELIEEHLAKETSKYIVAFRDTSLGLPLDWSHSSVTRYRRAIAAYRSILVEAGFPLPEGLEVPNISGLFGSSLRDALQEAAEQEGRSDYESAAHTLAKTHPSWNELFRALSELRVFIENSQHYKEFNRGYINRPDGSGNSWHDDTLRGVLSLMESAKGVRTLRAAHEQHDPNTERDYAEMIAEDLVEGRLVILDQSMGDPDYNQSAADRIAWAIFKRQQEEFINPRRDSDDQILRPPDVLLYIEEAHNLLPAKTTADLDKIWSRLAKEGSKYYIGLMFATQEPSSLQTNILSNTDNWFVAHLNGDDEIREIKKYYDFEDFSEQIKKVPEPGFIRMRTLSNPFIVPIQVDRFEAAKSGHAN